MALGATVYKATVDISDLDRSYYAKHVLTVARHPSETEERLMLRVLAFCRHAGERTEFGRGLSTEGEPALWELDDTGAIAEWVDVGWPDVKQVRRAAGRSAAVTIFTYDEARYVLWWEQNAGEFSKIDKLCVIAVDDAFVAALAAMADRNMRLAVTIQDGVAWVSDDARSVEVTFKVLKETNSRW
mgnify:CR=1 FL=1